MLRLLSAPFLGLVLIACGGGAPKATLNPAGQGTGTGMCEVLRHGGQFRVVDGADSVIVLATAPVEKRTPVRRFLRNMATRHEERRFAYQSVVRHRDALPAHATSLEYSETGARLMYRPLKAEQLEALARGLRRHLGALPGRCGKS